MSDNQRQYIQDGGVKGLAQVVDNRHEDHGLEPAFIEGFNTILPSQKQNKKQGIGTKLLKTFLLQSQILQKNLKHHREKKHPVWKKP